MSLTIGQNRETSLETDQTPPTIRGVQLTNLDGTAISIDWLSVTLPNTDKVRRIVEGTFGELKPQETRVYGYSQSSPILTYGRAFWSDDKPEQGLHIRLPASALTEWDGTWWLLLTVLVNNGGKFTRLDIAFDDQAGLLDLDVIAHHWHNGEMVSRYRSMTEYREAVAMGQGQGQLSGLAFGNRQSQSYIRIYDKALEQRKKGNLDVPDQWTRLEIECKDEKATAIVDGLLQQQKVQAVGVYLAGLMTGLFDVVLSPGTDTNKSRWARPSWWARFVANVEKVRLSLAKLEKTLEQVKSWFADSIAPMAAVIMVADHKADYSGYDWLIEAIEIAQGRWKRRHKILAGLA